MSLATAAQPAGAIQADPAKEPIDLVVDCDAKGDWPKHRASIQPSIPRMALLN